MQIAMSFHDARVFVTSFQPFDLRSVFHVEVLIFRHFSALILKLSGPLVTIAFPVQSPRL